MKMKLVVVFIAGLNRVSSWSSGAAYASGTELVEVSAPILPRVSVLYAAVGINFHASHDERDALDHDADLTFDFLMT